MRRLFALWGVRLISRIPLWIWYRVSDLGFLIVYYLIGYRKNVVFNNLQNSFPSWSEAKIQEVAKEFYRHFCDVIVETIKSFTISDRQLARRVELLNPEIAERMEKENKGSLLLATHYGNFEWMCARLDLMCQDRIPTFAVYNPFSSDTFEYLITKMRGRRGLQMLPMRSAMSKAVRQLQSFCLFGFIFDQSPHRGNRLYYTSFLNQDTAFHTSIAKIALRTKAPIYYADVSKVRRGRYQVKLIRLETEDFLPETPKHIHDYTDFQVAHLSQSILRNPAYWLWSHKRWKYQAREGDYFSTTSNKSKA